MPIILALLLFWYVAVMIGLCCIFDRELSRPAADRQLGRAIFWYVICWAPSGGVLFYLTVQ